MDSGTLTRDALRDELQIFAEEHLSGLLLHALQDQHEAIASKVCQSIKADSVLGRALHSNNRSELDSDPPGEYSSEKSSLKKTSGASKSGKPRERKDPRRFHSAESGGSRTADLTPKPKQDLWQPSLKYEAKVAARAAPRRTRGIRVTTREGAERKGSKDTEDADKVASARALLHQPVNEQGMSDTAEGLLTSTISESPVAKADTSGWQFLRTMVESTVFEQGSGLIVVFNSISMGYDANYMAAHPNGESSEITIVSEQVFCLLFTVELLLRIGAFGSEFFANEDSWKWNLFDTIVVLSQVLEQTIIYVSATKERKVNLSILRLLRFLRVIRFARLFRVFHLFDDLRVIVSSIGASISSLAWSMLLLMILIYVFSLLFLQSVASSGLTEHHEELHFYFSSLFRTTLTMFECIVGGVNWDKIVWPMALDLSPWLAVAFCTYISASLFAMMNIVTGIFVDKAMSSVREDKDVVLARRVRDLFFTKDKSDTEAIDEEITWEIFCRKLETQAMKDYFAQINVEISEARSLFDLMDTDGSGSLDSEEIVQACLQLRGPARALELSALARDVSDLRQQLSSIDIGIQQLLLRH